MCSTPHTLFFMPSLLWPSHFSSPHFLTCTCSFLHSTFPCAPALSDAPTLHLYFTTFLSCLGFLARSPPSLSTFSQPLCMSPLLLPLSHSHHLPFLFLFHGPPFASPPLLPTPYLSHRHSFMLFLCFQLLIQYSFQQDPALWPIEGEVYDYIFTLWILEVCNKVLNSSFLSRNFHSRTSDLEPEPSLLHGNTVKVKNITLLKVSLHSFSCLSSSWRLLKNIHAFLEGTVWMLIRRNEIRKVIACGDTQTFLHHSLGKSVDLVAYQTL